jgi:hypothetical protein
VPPCRRAESMEKSEQESAFCQFLHTDPILQRDSSLPSRPCHWLPELATQEGGIFGGHGQGQFELGGLFLGGHGGFRLATGSHAEERAQFFPEHDAGADDGEGEEDHGPDAEGGGHAFATSEGAEEVVDGGGDGEVFLFLGEDE